MNGEQLRRRLQRDGFQVKEFTPFHFRVNERLDIFPNERHESSFAWHDIRTGARGWTKVNDYPKFIPRYLAEHVVIEPHAPPVDPLIWERGWWNCPLFGCKFKMREGGEDFFKRQIAHYDEHEKNGE